MKRSIALLLALLLASPFSVVSRVSYAAGRSERLISTWSILSRKAKLGVAGLVIGGMLGGPYGYHYESARAAHIPLSFSEVTQTEQDAEAQGVKLDPTQVFLMHTNEGINKVWEASNDGHEKLALGSEAHRFAVQ